MTSNRSATFTDLLVVYLQANGLMIATETSWEL
jgi:hypothetical protein